MRSKAVLIVTPLVCAVAFATIDGEKEIRAMEKAHSAVTEIQTDFHRALREAHKKGDLKGCRIKNVRPEEMKVGRTSHRLRNPKNAPPEWAKPYLEKFAAAKKSDIPKQVITKIGPNQWGYLQPLYVEPICLNCHGRAVKKETKDAIHEAYPEDQAINFDVGDFRGLLWLELIEK